MGLRRVPSTSSASGVWDCDEQSLAKRAGVWPVIGQAWRYYRLSGFASTTLNENSADLTEIELYVNDSVQTISSVTSNVSWTAAGQDISEIIDGVISDGSRALRDFWNPAGVTITLDLGSSAAITHIKIYSLYTQPRFPASFTLSGSNDNASYTTIGTITCGTSFTSLGGNVFASEKLQLP